MSPVPIQKAMCAKHGSLFVEAEPDVKSGLAIKTIGLKPIYGVRHAKCNGTTGWYIWCGEYSNEPTFFEPLCTGHLPEYLPLVVPYLGLAPGYSFIIDEDGYEGVWYSPDVASQR